MSKLLNDITGQVSLMKKNFIVLCLVFLFVPIVDAAYSLRVRFDEAMKASANQQYDKAVLIFEEIVSNAPDFAQAYYYLAVVYREQGDNGKALKALEKSIELNPQYVDAYDSLAKLYFSLTELDKTIEYSNRALEIDPNFASAHLTLGWTYLLGKESPLDAIEHFKVVTDQSDAKFALFGLGMAYYMDGQSFKTLEMITRLRASGENVFAEELEAMIRKGPFNPKDARIAEMVFPKLRKPMNAEASEVEVKKEPEAIESVEDSKNSSNKKSGYKVRLRAPVDLESIGQEPVVSTDEKIKQLQQQGKELDIQF